MSNKKDKISDKSIINLSEISLFLQINYNEFNLKILYTNRVG
jgi:hypothetical protein